MSSPQSSAILLPSGDRESDRREHSRASSASHDATKQFVQRAYEVINRAKTVQSPTVFTPSAGQTPKPSEITARRLTDEDDDCGGAASLWLRLCTWVFVVEFCVC